MTVEIKELLHSAEKSAVCEDILRQLPDWFGIDAAIMDYVEQSKNLIFYAAFDNHKPIGFVSIKNHNKYTAEMYVMGILKDYHRQGIGRRLINSCENYCKATKRTFLTVKTLDELRANKSYEKTRLFYLSMGFLPLEVFPLLWGKENPCLFLAKHIDSTIKTLT